MNSVKELVGLGSELSSNFLNSKANMTKGLEKMASTHGMNREEVRRVAEMANTKTYLEMRKTSEYVEFDLADPAKVELEKAETPVISNRPGTHSDYFTSPISKAAEFEKVASTEISPEEDYIKIAGDMDEQLPAFEASLWNLQDSMSKQAMEYDHRVGALSGKVRQLILEGADKNHIKSLFSAVDDTDTVWNGVEENLGEEFPMLKSASTVNGVVDSGHPIYKEAKELRALAGNIINDVVVHETIREVFNKEAALVVEKVKTPLKVLGGMALFGTGVSYGKRIKKADEQIRRLKYISSMTPRKSL